MLIVVRFMVRHVW